MAITYIAIPNLNNGFKNNDINMIYVNMTWHGSHIQPNNILSSSANPGDGW